MFLIFLLGFSVVAVAIAVFVILKEEQHYVKEAQLSQTLEIPCLENATSANLSNYPLKWVVVSLNIISAQVQIMEETTGYFCRQNEKCWILLHPAECVKQQLSITMDSNNKGKSKIVHLQHRHHKQSQLIKQREKPYLFLICHEDMQRSLTKKLSKCNN